ncbi:hypothetical protein FB451DRAFT_1224855 [Mycena latifolia]|nr:hypothetical protein FB451DRAFT_1224855 [Mycena latifolia]
MSQLGKFGSTLCWRFGLMLKIFARVLWFSCHSSFTTTPLPSNGLIGAFQSNIAHIRTAQHLSPHSHSRNPQRKVLPDWPRE